MIPLTAMQLIIREKEARLVEELSKEKNAQAKHAAGWFEKRWGCGYEGVLPKSTKIQVK